MRTSHRQIRKRILDAKSKISDEEFFSSRAYNGYLTDLAEAATKRYPTCSSVNDMKEKNKQEFFGTRDEAISNGYSPCGRCKP